MNFSKLSILGTPNIGVYLFANDYVALVGPSLTEGERRVIEETLGVEVVEVKISDSILIGVLIAGNNNGIVIPKTVRESELSELRSLLKGYHINIEIVDSRLTALGNVVLANNKAAVVGSKIEYGAITKISDSLGVEVVVRDLMNLSIPGSIAVVNSSGGAIHPDVSDDDLRYVEEVMGVEVERATVNSGIPFVKAGLVANNNGVLVGESTTGPEILRIQRGLKVL
ncbi:MAG: translation initiation factor IF-6 [Sulfolobales archaeon]|nr:translation initiation factor IF-6 [Sulfolobales archaeon]MCX8199494.1 translation initiation factor IF-6 [Sulfolobales archaeon]MDW8170830.1 translation initiation factor IF-6 [Desulfurococcaceae archaeon]